ncbi:MAG: O-antigen ligase family protein [Acidobacteria bacterium]|nr:O-antigen ligase family protein [Acidobacteriota bacterium]
MDKAITIGLMLVVVFATVAHGVVEPWSVFIFELMSVVLILMWTIKAVADKYLILAIPHTIWPLAVLILLGLAQSIIWGGGVVGSDAAGSRQSLSFDVDSTRGTVMVLCSLLALAVLAANFLTGASRLLASTKFLIFFGAATGVFGLVQHFSGSSSVYWLRQTQVAPFGPFFNRDHFAGFMELFIALPIALIVTRYAQGEMRIIYGIAAMFMGVAAVFTLSRGGMISMLSELIFISAMGFRHYKTTGLADRPGNPRMVTSIAAVVVILAAIVIGVIWIGPEPVINRIATGNPDGSDQSNTHSFYSVRGAIWEDTWTMIRHNPLTGVGLGAYETAYPIYARDNGVQGITAAAHNDYLQVLADAGVIGAAVVLWFIIVLFRAIARGIRSPDPLVAAIALGGGAGLFGLLVHSLFDFNLHLPSHAMVFLILSTVISQLGATVEATVDARVTSEATSTQNATSLIREVTL